MSEPTRVMAIFEKLATNSHQRVNLSQLVNDEFGDIRMMLHNKDAKTLKIKLSNGEYLADTGKVTSI